MSKARGVPIAETPHNYIFGGILLKLEHVPDDLLEDYKVDKDYLKNNYKNKDKKIKDSFSFGDLLSEKQRVQILNYISE